MAADQKALDEKTAVMTRDRDGSFDPKIVPKGQRRLPGPAT